jgi:hypothetical protein
LANARAVAKRPRFIYKLAPRLNGPLPPPEQQLKWVAHYWTAGLRTLPDFVIIGAQRAGTTSLYNYLIQHPCIAPAVKKEVHYFDLCYEYGERWYRGHFMRESERKKQPVQGYPMMTGEASPYYLYHPLVPERLKALLPNAKLLVLLRNPADRALSQFFFNKKNGKENEKLGYALQNETERMKGAVLDAPNARRGTEPHRRRSYLQRGIYVDQLQHWFNHFPREQFHLINSERMNEDPATAVRGALEFIGLPDNPDTNFEKHHVTRYPDLDPSIRDWLVDYFRPHNERLFELLGERYEWE